MRWVFAVSLVLGMLSLIGYLMFTKTGDQRADRPPNPQVPQIVAGAVAFGMGGLSASYAGWSLWVATGAALVAAGLAAWYARSVVTSGGEDPD